MVNSDCFTYIVKLHKLSTVVTYNPNHDVILNLAPNQISKQRKTLVLFWKSNVAYLLLLTWSQSTRGVNKQHQASICHQLWVTMFWFTRQDWWASSDKTSVSALLSQIKQLTGQLWRGLECAPWAVTRTNVHARQLNSHTFMSASKGHSLLWALHLWPKNETDFVGSITLRKNAPYYFLWVLIEERKSFHINNFGKIKHHSEELVMEKMDKN